LNTSDRLYFSKYALDSNSGTLSNELDIFEFDDDFGQDQFFRENNFDGVDDDLWEDESPEL
jgi:hypothetical protein